VRIRVAPLEAQRTRQHAGRAAGVHHHLRRQRRLLAVGAAHPPAAHDHVGAAVAHGHLVAQQAHQRGLLADPHAHAAGALEQQRVEALALHLVAQLALRGIEVVRGEVAVLHDGGAGHPREARRGHPPR
jgi:hypothetical protein